MRRVLFIPHHPLYGGLKLRLAEMARFMPEDSEVYLLNWTAAADRSLASRIGAALRDLFRRPIVRMSGPWRILEIPMLHRPLAWAGIFNGFLLGQMIKKLKVDCVVNGSYYLFSLGRDRGYKYIVDIADLPASPDSGSFERFIERAVKKEIETADIVTASSSALADHLKEHYGAGRVHFLPNGADLGQFRQVKDEDKDEVLNKLGWKDRWVIGYIGYIGPWVDVSFMVEVFHRVKKDIPAAALLFVGSGPDLDKWRRAYADNDIVFLGPVPPEKIEAYFCACDAGVLPNTKSLFQDTAFHLKVIEFAAARRFVISSDLEEVKRLNIPSVCALPLEFDRWVDALKRIHAMRWDDAWGKELDKYDWRQITASLTQL